ncbi:hypothetical protein [Gordonia polyisoprenivorans]|uniref:hypothetical protein n=1 Tax=Gordonia polyisoprenivorans TaxID=84595 RepID=UPI0003704112|nr:hypothetical protein [Gordonia polyisoprenivorans]
MHKKLVGLLVALAAVTGLLLIGGGHASAADVRDTPTRVWVGFTPAETKQIAASGVESIFDTPQLRPYWYANPDRDSRYKTFYVPGKGYVVYTSAQAMVKEAASHPNGRVWVSYNKTLSKPLTLWTQF